MEEMENKLVKIIQATNFFPVRYDNLVWKEEAPRVIS